ncbi:hypothetical protein [Nonomuraea bangladeshensis]|uniref:hypothetical protein n=1 Tax=Nonomuraea bangladeshensis TaxID=404385 RepID=UPI0031D513C3
MANEVKIVVTGRDKTSGLFSGLKKQFDTSFAGMRETAQKQMQGAVDDAGEAGEQAGRELQRGIKDGLGDAFAPLKEQTTKQRQRAPKDGDEIGGAFARGFKSSIESAVKSLPSVKITADSSEAQVKIAAIRSSIQSLSSKTVGIDIDTDQAEGELRAIIESLREIDGDTVSADVRADVATALAKLQAVQRSLDDVNGRTVTAKVDVDTSRAGSGLMQGIAKAVTAGVGEIKGALSTTFEMAATAAKPALIGALGGVLASVGPALGTVLGGGIVMGLGAGLAGLAAMAHLYIEDIDKEWDEAEKERAAKFNASAEAMAKTWREFKRDMIEGIREVSQPITSTFGTIRSSLKDLGAELKPTLKAAFVDIADGANSFLKGFIGGLKELKPALQPIASAFAGLMGQVGPQMKNLFKDIASSLSGLANVVLENKTIFTTLFMGLLQSIPATINAISGLISFFGTMVGVVNNVHAVLGRVFVGASEAVLGFAEKLLGTLRTVAQALGNMPGMEDISRKLVSGIDQALGKVNEWKRAAQDAGKAVELKANIWDLQQKLDKARAELADPNLTKERRAQLNAEITRLLEAKGRAITELGDPKLVKEYRSAITTEISELQSKLATAKKELQNPELTKERKSQLKAEISQLQTAVAQAKSALASIPNKTVTVTVRTVGDTSIYRAGNVSASTRARGGIIGAAGGGPRSNMTLVGEQGPELVRLPFGSTVIPAGQSKQMLNQGGGGGGVVVNLYVQGSIRSDRDLIQIIRDEFTRGGFRGAVATS